MVWRNNNKAYHNLHDNASSSVQMVSCMGDEYMDSLVTVLVSGSTLILDMTFNSSSSGFILFLKCVHSAFMSLHCKKVEHFTSAQLHDINFNWNVGIQWVLCVLNDPELGVT